MRDVAYSFPAPRVDALRNAPALEAAIGDGVGLEDAASATEREIDRVEDVVVGRLEITLAASRDEHVVSITARGPVWVDASQHPSQRRAASPCIADPPLSVRTAAIPSWATEPMAEGQ